MQRLRKALLLVFLLALPLAAACAHTPHESSPARTLYQEGQSLLTQGRPVEALDRFRASLDLSREIGDRQGVAHNLNEIGILHTQRRELDAARDCFVEAELIYRGLDMSPEVSKSLNNRAMTYVLDRDFDAALGVYEELLEWDAATGNDLGRAITCTNLGHLYEVHLQQTGKALAAYERALALLTELGDEGRSAALRERVDRLSREGTP